MKKSLVALAVLASCGGVMAQSSVTLYGLFDVGVEKLPGKSTRVSNSVGNGSRLGFRGVEDLGGGLQASFVLETGFATDKGGFNSHSGLANIGNRATWLSMGSKSVGTVSLGRGYVGAYTALVKADPLANGFGQRQDGAESLYSNLNTTRFDNVIRYQSPNFYGFSADLGLGLKGDAGETRAVVDAAPAVGSATRNITSATRTGYTLAAMYDNGPLYVGVGVARVPGLAAQGGGDVGGKVWSFSGTYDLKVVKAYANYELDDRYSGRKGAGHVGLSAPLGAGTLMAYYGIDRNGGTALSDTYKQGSVAYRYNLSKRTSLYGAVTNDNVSGLTKVSRVGNVDGTSVQLGLRHTF